MAITVMQRYEMKYLLDERQTAYFERKITGPMQADQYGLTGIASLYYDTPDSRLVRASLEKPDFKEKIRLRSYGLATDRSPVFLELKRKYDGIVYKRRIETTVPEADAFFRGMGLWSGDRQIRREITYFRDYYEALVPACLVLYDRTAYFEPGGDLRLTLDRNPRYRTEDLTLTRSMDGIPLLPGGWTILEIKVQKSLPLWLTSVLSEGEIFKSSFSKYGEAYRKELYGKKEEAAAVPGTERLRAA